MSTFTLLKAFGFSALLCLSAAGATVAAPAQAAAPLLPGLTEEADGLGRLLPGALGTAEGMSGEAPIQLAQGNCSRAASQAAAQTGGQVLSVSSREQNGRVVCVVTVLIPGQDGGRPRRTTITVPG